MKAIIISIRPQWVELILNFIKKDEIRKGTAIGKAITRLIKQQGVAPMLIYCTKGKEKLWRHNNLQTFGKLSKDVEKQFCAYGKTSRELDDKLLDFLYENGIEESISRGVNGTLLNGKVVARFNATAEEITTREDRFKEFTFYETSLDMEDLLKQSCLDYNELDNYLQGEKGTTIHINDLEIFDKPKELSEFKSYKKNIVNTKINGMVFETELDNSLIKAPQSFCYVEVE